MKNVIIYGAPERIKNASAQALCAHYGMDRVIDEARYFDTHTKAVNGNLILTRNGDAMWQMFGRMVPFAMAMRDAGMKLGGKGAQA